MSTRPTAPDRDSQAADKPTPGGKDSLNILFDNYEAIITQLETEALLHVEMFNDEWFCKDLMRRLQYARQGMQQVEDAVFTRIHDVMR